MGGDKKVPLKFKLYAVFYPVKIFFKSLINKFGGDKKWETLILKERKQ